MQQVFILTCLFCVMSSAQVVQTLKIDFIRTTLRNDKQEQVRGTIYFQHPDQMAVIVHDPVHQWIFAGQDSMILYYPDDTLAFRFTTSFPVTFPFFQAFLGVVQEDYGLSSIGYTLLEHEMHDSLLTTTWIPPEEAPDDVGDFHITYAGNTLISAQYLQKNGDIITETIYSNHIPYGAYAFPLQIEKIQFLEQDTIEETVLYTDPEFNCELPDSIINFRLPAHIPVEYITW